MKAFAIYTLLRLGLFITSYAVLAWQIGFPLYAWRPRWRPVLIGGAVVGWLGTALVYGLPLLGPALLIGALSFVSADGWRRLLGWATRLVGRAESAARAEESAVVAGRR